MLKQGLYLIVAGAVGLSVAGCATTSAPPGPSLAVMPAKGKPYEQFQREDEYCPGQAARAVGGQNPGDQAAESTVNGAVVGTALGALAGAAIGSTSGHVGAGAAIGAGTGLIAGTAVGAENGRVAGGNVQARYDTVYAQCMSAKGNQVNAAPPPRATYVYEETAPVYVYPRPYYWGYGRRW